MALYETGFRWTAISILLFVVAWGVAFCPDWLSWFMETWETTLVGVSDISFVGRRCHL
jgi:hypothetical protein